MFYGSAGSAVDRQLSRKETTKRTAGISWLRQLGFAACAPVCRHSDHSVREKHQGKSASDWVYQANAGLTNIYSIIEGGGR
jgi:hypothetical protein